MLNPLHLVTLRAVVAEGSFSAAAAKLGYTASAVSQQVAALERVVGVPLFERTVRSTRPTAAGLQLAERAAGILGALDALERDIRAAHDGGDVAITVGSFGTASKHIMPSVVTNFMTAHPNVQVVLREGEPRHLWSAAVDGAVDVVLAYRCALVQSAWPDELTVTPLLTEDLLLLVPQGHPAARAADRGERLDIRSLGDARWISYPEGRQHDQALANVCASGSFTPHVVFRSTEYDVLPGLVAEGVGLALIASLGYSGHEGVRALSVGHPAARRHIVALHRPHNANPVLAPMLDQLKASSRRVERRLRAAELTSR